MHNITSVLYFYKRLHPWHCETEADALFSQKNRGNNIYKAEQLILKNNTQEKKINFKFQKLIL